MKFKLEKTTKTGPRVGQIVTAHGVIETPAFVPVATQAAFKGVPPEAAKAAGTQVIFANTFHLHLSPGEAVVKAAGGVHKFMNWSGPIMTDSGGFQVFSLGAAYGQGVSKVATSKPEADFRRFTHLLMGSDADENLLPASSLGRAGDAEKNYPSGSGSLVKIDDDGVDFRSPRDGSLHRLTPESSIKIQHDLGADIILSFDECTTPQAPYEYQVEALRRTDVWAKRSLAEHERLGDEQALYGIVQGGRFADLRTASARSTAALNFAGFAIGGSFNKEDIGTVVELVNTALPPDRPRHLLGIGEIEDIFAGVAAGVDTLDCVTPTRLGRHGTVETKQGRLNLISGKFASDFNPIETDCPCPTCQNYSRAYLSHLFRSREMLSTTLASVHNLHFYAELMKGIRQAIRDDRLALFQSNFLESYL